MLYTIPSDFNLHKGLARVMKAKTKMIEEGVGIDWATAEALAWASLMDEGVHVRLSGQVSEPFMEFARVFARLGD